MLILTLRQADGLVEVCVPARNGVLNYEVSLFVSRDVQRKKSAYTLGLPTSEALTTPSLETRSSAVMTPTSCVRNLLLERYDCAFGHKTCGVSEDPVEI